MATASADEQAKATGLLDLEKELICSICTEVLYQPLTLLDCLHTFCGSCLKEWFSWQAQRYKNSSSSVPGENPYTCPSCRASVRETRPNATVTTLLDMFVKANPERDRSATEKEEIAKQYKPGDIVIPKVETRRRRSRDGRRAERDLEDEEDRRLMEAVRERSRVEAEGRSTSNRRQTQGHLDPGNSSANERSRSREQREREERHRRRREEDRRRRRGTEAAQSRSERAQTIDSVPTAQAVRDADTRQRERQIEHQSSLRSLMSASDTDGAMEEEILRQIIDEGLLEGINLDELNGAQADELSERIAEAYRRRHPSRRFRNRSGSTTPETRQRHQRSHSAQSGVRTEGRPGISANENRPPVSRPHLLEASEAATQPSSHHRRRASDTSRRQTSPNTRNSRTTSVETVRRQAARSATDLSTTRPSSSDSRPRARHTSDVRRTTTDPESPRLTDMWRSGGARDPAEQNHRAVITQGTTESPQHLSPTIEQTTTFEPIQNLTINTRPAAEQTTRVRASSEPRQTSETQAQRTNTAQQDTPKFLEPSISCDRCSKPSIQYKLYKHCSKCSMNICLQCYRQKKGCKHWFGFGAVGKANFAAAHPPSSKSPKPEPPHILIGRKYLPPPPNVALRTEIDQSSNTNKTYTSSDPASRLQEGKFCDRCHEFANPCFWGCNTCNDGEWGFCNECVNTQHCCTHPLRPIAHKDFAPGYKRELRYNGPRLSNIPVRASVLLTPGSMPTSTSPSSDGTLQPEQPVGTMVSLDLEPDYLPLIFVTHCDICAYPIPPSNTRFHCPFHEPAPTDIDRGVGDYDICSSCYTSLGKTGTITTPNGINGWRRCPIGHRMIITGFEERGEGQRRVVVQDLIGGWALKDKYFDGNVQPNGKETGTWLWKENPESSAPSRAPRAKSLSAPNPTTFPPSGGVGLSCQAMWSYLPDHEEDPATKDELLFPKNAEIREAYDINGDWWWGVYMGDMGVFPGNYVKVIGMVN